MSREDVHRQLSVLLKEKKVLDYGRCNLDSSHISHKKKSWWINASCCVASQFFSVAVFGIQTSVLRLRERSDDGIWPEALCCCPPLFCDIQRGWAASKWRRNLVRPGDFFFPLPRPSPRAGGRLSSEAKDDGWRWCGGQSGATDTRIH